MIFSKEVIKKCAYDTELKKIVYYVAELSKDELEEFKKKLNLYFMDKNTENDVHAYKFYKMLLRDKNALILKNEIKKILNE